MLTTTLVAMGPAIATGQGTSFDLTGTWTGKIICKTVTAAGKATVVVTPAAAVTQTGSAIGVALDFGGGVVAQYTGLADPDAKKPLVKGEFGLIRCGTDSTADLAEATDEMGRFAVTAKAPPAVKATFKGSTVLAEPGSVGLCTWKWTRTAVADPGVATTCAQ